jgi:uncharacterized protein YqjF (DUF2071 family)
MRLPKHPFPVQALFRNCHLVNFAVDPSALARVLPAPLVPDVYADRAWLSVVIAQMSSMRPVGVPELLGVTYNQVVYRAVVRHGNARGVHFLRSDTDSRLMSALGNAMSFFAFHHADIALGRQGDAQTVELHSHEGMADIRARFRPAAQLPPTSVFPDLATAKTQLVELFDAYHPRADRPVTDLVSIRRNDWELAVVNDELGEYALMRDSAWFPAGSAVLDSVFAVEDLTYRWNRLAQLHDAGRVDAER